jgi:hypothetical protein
MARFLASPSGELTTIYNSCALPNCADGEAPYGLIQGGDGNFYGTTVLGGVNKTGVFFRLSTGLSSSR